MLKQLLLALKGAACRSLPVVESEMLEVGP